MPHWKAQHINIGNALTVHFLSSKIYDAADVLQDVK